MVEFALLVSSAEQRGRRSRAEEREGLGCMGGGGDREGRGGPGWEEGPGELGASGPSCA